MDSNSFKMNFEIISYKRFTEIFRVVNCRIFSDINDSINDSIKYK